MTLLDRIVLAIIRALSALGREAMDRARLGHRADEAAHAPGEDATDAEKFIKEQGGRK